MLTKGMQRAAAIRENFQTADGIPAPPPARTTDKIAIGIFGNIVANGSPDRVMDLFYFAPHPARQHLMVFSKHRVGQVDFRDWCVMHLSSEDDEHALAEELSHDR